MSLISLSQLKTSLNRVKTYIDNLFVPLTETITAVEESKVDKGEVQSITIAASNWAADTTYSSAPFKATVSADGVSASSVVIAMVSTDSISAVKTAQVLPTIDCGDSALSFYSASSTAPTGSITVYYTAWAQAGDSTASGRGILNTGVATDTSGLETSISTLNTNVSSIETRMTTAETNITTLQGQTLPTVTTSDNGKLLMVVNGKWTVTSGIYSS